MSDIFTIGNENADHHQVVTATTPANVAALRSNLAAAQQPAAAPTLNGAQFQSVRAASSPWSPPAVPHAVTHLTAQPMPQRPLPSAHGLLTGMPSATSLLGPSPVRQTAAPAPAGAAQRLRSNLAAFPAPPAPASFTTASPSGAMPNLSPSQWRPASVSTIGTGPLQPAPHIVASSPLPSGLLTPKGTAAPHQAPAVQYPGGGQPLTAQPLPAAPVRAAAQGPSQAASRPRGSAFPSAPAGQAAPSGAGYRPLPQSAAAPAPSASLPAPPPQAPAGMAATTPGGALAAAVASPAGQLLTKTAGKAFHAAGRAARRSNEIATRGGGSLPSSSGWLKR